MLGQLERVFFGSAPPLPNSTSPAQRRAFFAGPFAAPDLIEQAAQRIAAILSAI
jgi:hypothetical protein